MKGWWVGGASDSADVCGGKLAMTAVAAEAVMVVGSCSSGRSSDSVGGGGGRGRGGGRGGGGAIGADGAGGAGAGAVGGRNMVIRWEADNPSCCISFLIDILWLSCKLQV